MDEDIVAKALKKGNFDFLAAVTDRAYPTIDVPVYLDEVKVQELIKLDDAIAELDDKAKESYSAKDFLADQGKLISRRDELKEELNAGAYHFIVQGISQERLNQIEEEVEGAFPTEYEEIESPITGAKSRVAQDNPKRDEFNVNLTRYSYIKAIRDSQGNEADSMDISQFVLMWNRLPLLSRVKVDIAIQEATIATDFYKQLADEVF